MLQVSVIDSVAEERLKTVNWLRENLEKEVEGIEYLPRLAFKPISMSELKFVSTPDLIVIGPVLALSSVDELSHIKAAVPDVPLILVAPEQQLSLATVEYLARAGIEEVLPRNIGGADLLRRMVMISAKLKRRSNCQLIIVDSAKGGVGATTIASGLGELLAESGKRILLLDTDDERQSLSRFLQVRPFINEAFQGLLSGGRPVTSDFVEACVMQVWRDLPELWCMPPAGTGLLDGGLSSSTSRIVIAILEVLETLFDFIVVDSDSSRGTYRRILLRAADRVVFVCDADPASAFASCERLRRMREEISPNAGVHVVQNQRTSLKGIPSDLLQREFERVGGICAQDWSASVIPHCQNLATWPGSGMAAYTAASPRAKRKLISLAEEVGVPGVTEKANDHLVSLASDFIKRMVCKLSRRKMYVSTEAHSNVSRIEGPVHQLSWGSTAASEKLVENLVTPPQPIVI